jgi:hypothetical protein
VWVDERDLLKASDGSKDLRQLVVVIADTKTQDDQAIEVKEEDI